MLCVSGHQQRQAMNEHRSKIRDRLLRLTARLTVRGTPVASMLALPATFFPWPIGVRSAVADHKVDGRPYAKRVTVISSPSDGWSTYPAIQSIKFAMNFDIDVEVHSRGLMGFYLGQGTEDMREATFAWGSGSDTLVLAYTVHPDDGDSDGIQVATRVADSKLVGRGRSTARGTDVEAFPHLPRHGTNGGPHDRYVRAEHRLGEHLVTAGGQRGLTAWRGH